MQHSSNRYRWVGLIVACAALASCAGQETRKLEDFAGFNETREMLAEAFDCSWALSNGLPACVRASSANSMDAAMGDELVTIMIGPPASGEKLGLKLDHDKPDADVVRDFFAQLEPASVTGLQFNAENLPLDQLRGFLESRFVFTAEEIDRVVSDFQKFQETLASGDSRKGYEMAMREGSRPEVVRGRLRLAAGGRMILMERTPG